eukprot:7278433-Heterocapsa_arctica.AAC.1
MGYKFDAVENSRFGWVPYGEIFHWCQQQHKQDPKEQGVLTEANFWNMILHTKNVNTGKYSYNVMYWPNLGMAMIKAATEKEEDTEIDASKGQMEQRDRDGENVD